METNHSKQRYVYIVFKGEAFGSPSFVKVFGDKRLAQKFVDDRNALCKVWKRRYFWMPYLVHKTERTPVRLKVYKPKKEDCPQCNMPVEKPGFCPSCNGADRL